MASRVLIIDDESQFRKLIRVTMEAAGFEVREADAGLPGINETAYLKPDLIVLDLGLPDIDGECGESSKGKAGRLEMQIRRIFGV